MEIKSGESLITATSAPPAERLAEEIIRSVETMAPELKAAFDAAEVATQELLKLNDRATATSVASSFVEMAYPLFKELAKLATYSERIRSEISLSDPEMLAFRAKVKNAFPEEHSAVFRSEIVPSVDSRCGLHSYCTGSSLESKYFKIEPMSLLDAFQGYGYDHSAEEDGCLAPIFWQGFHERSAKHEYIHSLIDSWLRSYETPARPLRILDIGTGSCTTILKLKPSLPVESHFYGCEICPEIQLRGLDVLKRNSIVANLIIADAQSLPYNDNVFDMVVNFGSMDQMPDRQKAMDEIIRVMTPGGLGICRDQQFIPAQHSLLTNTWFRNLKVIWGLPPPDDLVGNKVQELNTTWISKMHFVTSFRKK